MNTVDTGNPVVWFDTKTGGHHHYYVRLLAPAWGARRSGEPAVYVTPAKTFEAHPDLRPLLTLGPVRFDLIPRTQTQEWRGLTPDELRPGSDFLKPDADFRDSLSFSVWEYAADAARRHGARHLVFLCLDDVLLATAAGRPFPCPFSGIYFRPWFHYKLAEGASKAARAAQVHGKLLLARILAHPDLRTLFLYDPFLAENLRAHPSGKVRFLPDPADPPPEEAPSREEARRSLGAPEYRHLFLFFGGVTPRKGFQILLDAAALLGARHRERLCLAFAGKAEPADVEALTTWSGGPGAGIALLRKHELIPEAGIPLWFRAADAVLTPYDRHVGMSGIILRAAAYGRPVLSQEFGVMGALVRRHRLGLTADTASPASVAAALAEMIDRGPAACFDPAAAAALAARHHPGAFTAALLDAVP